MSGASHIAMTVDSRSTFSRADDLYVVTEHDSLSPKTLTFGALANEMDLFGRPMLSAVTSAGARLELYSAAGLRGGGLDYVSLGMVNNPGGNRLPAPFYFAVGRPMEPVYVPLTGSAGFTGVTYGGYQDSAGANYVTSSDIALTANFATSSLSGSTSNFTVRTPSGGLHTPAVDLNFSFTATRTTHSSRPLAAAFTGTASNAAMNGRINGYFLGEPNGPPAEIGLSYALDAAGATSAAAVEGVATRPIMFGAAGLKANVAPTVTTFTPGPIFSTCTSGWEMGCGAAFRVSGVTGRKTTLGGALTVESARAFFVFDIDGKLTADRSDDRYIYSVEAISTIASTLTGFTTYADALGTARQAEGFSPSVPNSRVDIFEVQNVLQGGLDYLQIGRITGSLSVGTSGTSYFAHGREVSPSQLPTTGSGTFRGGTRGDYIDASGATFRTASDISLTLDFAARTLNGSATNFRAITPGGAPYTPPSSLDFTFNAAMGAMGFTGTATNGAMQGRVDGILGGRPGAVPEEIGMSYSLTTGGLPNQGPLMYGAGGLRRIP